MENSKVTNQHLMTTISKSLQQNASALVQSEQYRNARENESKQDRDFIGLVFDQLRAAFRSGFYELKGMTQEEKNKHIKIMKRQWLDAFVRAGMSDTNLVTYAINRMIDRGDKFIPVVGEFLDLCEEGRIPAGIKSHQDAWNEIKAWLMLAYDRRKTCDLSNEAFHTFVAEIEDQQALRERTSSTEQREAWASAYARTLDRLKRGQPIRHAPPPNQMKLEKKPAQKASKEFASSFLSQMRNGL